MGSGSLGSTSTSFLAVVRSTVGIGIPAAWGPLYRQNLGLALRGQAPGSRPVLSSRNRSCAYVLSGTERTKLKHRRTAAAAAAAANASGASSSRVDEVEAIKEILPDGNYHSFESLEEREDFWLTWRHLMPLHHASIDHGGRMSLSQYWPIQRDPRGTGECHVSSSALEIQHDCFSSKGPAGTRGSGSEHRRRRRGRGHRLRSSYQQWPGVSRATTRDSNLRRAASHPRHRQPSVYPFIRLQLRATRGMRVHPQSYRNGRVAGAAQSLIQVMLSDRYSVLAAPQIGIGYRMIAVRRPVVGGHASVIKLPPWRMSAPWPESMAHPIDEESDDREPKVEVFINPRIIVKGKIGLSSDRLRKRTSEEEEEEEESDPSFPFVRVPVRRPSWVVAQARTVDDRLVLMLLCGEKAGSFQRAMDYLDGFLAIDLATPSSKDLAGPQLRSLEKKAASVATWHPAAVTLAFYNLVTRSSVRKAKEEKEEEKEEEMKNEGEEGEYASCDYGDGRDLRTEHGPREKPTIASHDADPRMESDATLVRPKQERTDYVLPRVDHPACFTAYHEAGHAVVGRAFPDHVRVEGVFLEKAGSERDRAGRARGDADSASPSWSWSGGTEIVFLVSNKDLRALTVERMAVWLGGLISEELMFGRADTYDGPLCSGSFADDLVHVSRTARRYLDACHVSTDEYVSALHALFFAGNQDVSGESHVSREPLHQNKQGEDRGLGVLAAIADPDVRTDTGTTNLLQKAADAAAASAARWDAGISAARVQVAGSNQPDSALNCSSPTNCTVTHDTGTSSPARPIAWHPIELPPGTTGRGGLQGAEPRCRPLGLPRNGPYNSTLLAMIDEAYEIGRSILGRDVDKLHRLASLLMDKRRVKQNQIREIWGIWG